MYRSSRKVRIELLSLVGLAVALLCVGFGCGDDSKKRKKKPDQSGRPELPCEKQGYPCTFKAVDKDVNQRTLELMGGVRLRADQGANWKSALEWVRGKSSVAEATGSSNAIRFRLEGGRPAWVYLGPTGLRRTESKSYSESNDDSSDSTTRRMPVVAGDDRDPRDFKKALVLTADHPIALAVTKEVRQTLSNARGYKTVEFRTSLNGLEVSDFEDWGSFDFVYFLAHGACDNEECSHVSISSGIELAVLPEFADARWRSGQCGDGSHAGLTEAQQEEIENYEIELANQQTTTLQNSPHAGTPGLAVATEGTGCYLDEDSEENYVTRRCGDMVTWVMEAPFFRSTSPDFEDTLVVGNGCELFGSHTSDFAQVFGGEESAFLGWSNIVTASSHNPVIPDLVDLVTEEGIPAWTALRTLERDDGMTRVAPDFPDLAYDLYCDLDLTLPELRHSEREDTIRVREIIEVQDPYGSPVDDGETITPIVNGIAGDGQQDSLELMVLVEGIDEDLETVSSDPSGYEIRFEWDDEEIGETFNVGETGEPTPGDNYTYLVEIEDLPLGRDIDPDDTHSLTGIVELPEGGTSKTEAEDLVVNRCWGKYQAGRIEWSSERDGAAEQFGSVTILDGNAANSELAMGPDPPLKQMRAVVEETIDEPGIYPAGFVVRNHDLETRTGVEYSTPEDANGDPVLGRLVVEEVYEVAMDSEHVLMEGRFRGPVKNKSNSSGETVHTLDGTFRLPTTFLQNPGNADPTGLWSNMCGGSSPSD